MGISHEQEAQPDEQAAERRENGAAVSAANGGKPKDEQRHKSRSWVAGGVLLWLLAVAGMVALSFFVHAHRQPFPFELSISRGIQTSMTEPWIGAIFRFLTWMSDPFP